MFPSTRWGKPLYGPSSSTSPRTSRCQRPLLPRRVSPALRAICCGSFGSGGNSRVGSHAERRRGTGVIEGEVAKSWLGVAVGGGGGDVRGNKLSQWAGEDGGERHLSRAEWPTSSLAATLLFLSRSRLRFAHPAAATMPKKNRFRRRFLGLTFSSSSSSFPHHQQGACQAVRRRGRSAADGKSEGVGGGRRVRRQGQS